MRPTGTIVDPLPALPLGRGFRFGECPGTVPVEDDFKGRCGNFQTVLKTVVYKQGFLGVILFTIKCESTVCLQK